MGDYMGTTIIVMGTTGMVKGTTPQVLYIIAT
jgi:hypothetical protein